MATPDIWLLVILGFALARVAEARVNRKNLKVLRAAGARESAPVLMRAYYWLTLLVAPAAMVEQLLSAARVTDAMLFGGLALVLAAVALRTWAIASLGAFWSMRLMWLPGLRPLGRGPYKVMDNPEYFSRLMEGAGLCLMLGAKRTVAVYLLLGAVSSLRIASVEKRLLLATARPSE